VTRLAVLRRDREAGTSLAELLVSMLILGVIVIAVATIAIGFQRSTGQIAARQDQVDGARTASERMAKVMRTAVKPSSLMNCTAAACSDIDAFLAATPTTMKFYANLNNPKNAVGPSQVSYTVATSGVDAGKLIERVQTPDSATPDTAIGYTYCDATLATATPDCKLRLKVQTLATGVVVDSTHTLFSYFSDTDSVNAMVPAGAGSSLTAAQIDQVLSVELRPTVQSTSNTKPKPTTYIQRILLPNQQAVLRTDEEATP
jgi:type II secretory pathway pseudopilin PulG